MRHRSTAGDITIIAHDVGRVGGMEIQISRLVEGLLACGRRVTVIARTCDVPAHENLARIAVPSPSMPFAAFYPWFALTAGAILSRRPRGMAIVHTAGAIVPNAVDVATLHFCHHAFAALEGPSRASRDTPAHRANAAVSATLSKAGERIVYGGQPSVRAAVAISDGVRREVEQWFPRLAPVLRTIPHGVDHARFAPDPARRARVREELGLSAGAHVALFVGGDWRRKGLEHAIAAIAVASRWRLAIVGHGDEAAYAAIARTAGVRDRVHFLGPSNDMPALFAAADAFVLPTSYETFSLVTYEAAAVGLPLLVTRVSGPDQLIREGVNGAFLDDSPARTAAWLTRLQDADLRATFGAAARRSAQPYTWDAAVERHVELYDELAQTPRRQSSARRRPIMRRLVQREPGDAQAGRCGAAGPSGSSHERVSGAPAHGVAWDVAQAVGLDTPDDRPRRGDGGMELHHDRVDALQPGGAGAEEIALATLDVDLEQVDSADADAGEHRRHR